MMLNIINTLRILSGATNVLIFTKMCFFSAPIDTWYVEEKMLGY